MQVFLTSPWVPAEWVRAHGLFPRGAWSLEGLGGEELALGAGVCAFANALERWAVTHPEAAFVFSTHCDQLRRGFDGLADTAGLRAFLFNLPATWQTAAARQLFSAELERLGRFLITLGGHAPQSEELERLVTESNAARARLLAVAAWYPARAYAAALARFHWDGSVCLPPAPAKFSSGAIPLALVGGPLPPSQWHLLDTLEQVGGRVVLNATENGERSLVPSPALPAGKSTIEGLAQTCLEGCMDVFQRPNTRLYEWLQVRLAARQVRGLVLWHYVGCDLWRAEAQSLRETFGLPLLALDADETASGNTRTATRIEAFLESLRG